MTWSGPRLGPVRVAAVSPTGRLLRFLLLLYALVPVASSAAATKPSLAWQLLSQRTPAVLWAGRNVDVRVRLRNLGTATWSESAGDHLSYHWLSPDGKVVERDGLRTGFGAPVRPGETVELKARIHVPASAGGWLLEWEMVREQVAWYGPRSGGVPPRVPVRVVWRCGLLQTGFGLAGLALAVALRRLRPALGSRAWAAIEFGPVVWTWLGVGLVTVTFSEVAGQQLWSGGGLLAASAASLAALPIALVPGRLRSWAAGLVVALTSVLAVADAVYLRYFETVVPIVALTAARQLGQVEASVRSLLRATDAWLAVGAASALVFAVLWPRRRRAEGPPRRVRALISAALAAACLLGAVPALRVLWDGIHDPAIVDQVFSQEALVGRWGLVNVHLFDVLRTYREWANRSSPDPREEARVRAFLAQRAATSAAVAAKYGVAKGANLILIQVESLQQWVIGAKVRGVEITPFLNALREKALYFPFVFDQTGQGRSSDGEFAVLNSQHALSRGAVAFRRPGNHFVALPGILRAHGYSTLSAHPFEKGFWNRGVLHPRYGFQRMFFRKELGPGEVIGWGLADGVFFDRMVGPLRTEKTPFFAFLITLGLHHPFDLFPDTHKVLDVGELRGTPLGNYIHAMHYFDSSLASFIAALERSGLLADSVVALYGDHESGLYVEDHLLALAGESGWDPSVLVRLRRVPFFVLLPNHSLAGEVPVLGGQVDIGPTLLALLGIAPPKCFVGHALDPAVASMAVLNDGSAVGEGREFVAEGPAIPAEGACFTWPGGAPRPLAECRALARQGREELTDSRFVVIHDLAAKIAGTGSP
jgi:phosphoglycerol transferase MdoB-like AlkP superfamily enzyme